MERDITIPLPLLLHHIAAAADEERRRNARFVAAGLPSLPPSVTGFFLCTSAEQHQVLFTPEQIGLGLGLGLDLELVKLKTPKLEAPEIDHDRSEMRSFHLFSSPRGHCRGSSSLASIAARRRRKKVNERMQELARLMPWDRRMDTATLLEEARRYVGFLEAQVSMLRVMPVKSRLECGDRQEALRATVNSTRVQDWLYRRDLCVCSAEQMAQLGSTPHFLL